MKVLCISGSRADLGSIQSTYNALIVYGIDADIANYDGSFDYDSNCDLVVLCGDRFEILRAAVEFYIAKIPIAHLSGGDITEGSADDSMRHAITKLSSLHFPTNEESAKRIIQMGEDPERVYAIGYPGSDKFDLVDLKVAKKVAGIEHFSDNFIILIWHPNTMADDTKIIEEVTTVSLAIAKVHDDRQVIVINPNQDHGGALVAKHLKHWAETLRPFTKYCENLPRKVYLTLLAKCACLVGNSSSGFYEAPSFGTPVVNIGDRQKGRIVPANMTWAAVDKNDIMESINIAMAMPRVSGNPYYTGNAAEKIAEVISKIKDPKKLLHKKFYEIKY